MQNYCIGTSIVVRDTTRYQVYMLFNVQTPDWYHLVQSIMACIFIDKMTAIIYDIISVTLESQWIPYICGSNHHSDL